jgi:hypothetical protein
VLHDGVDQRGFVQLVLFIAISLAISWLVGARKAPRAWERNMRTSVELERQQAARMHRYPLAA